MAKVGQIVKEGMMQIASEKLKEADGSFYVASVSKLSSDKSNELRMKLKQENARLQIVKRRLGKRVLSDMSIDGLAELAETKDGSVGLIIPQEDAIPVAKHLVEFIKENEGTITVLGGLLEGKLLTEQEFESVAKLPSKEELLATVIVTVEAPIAQFINLTEQLIGDVIWAVEQVAQNKEEA